MNIFIRELKATLKSLLIWCAITALFALVGFGKFSAFYENPELIGVLDAMPQGMLDALSMNLFNLTTVTGFFGVMVIYFSLILGISAAMWGSDIIAKEERDRTVEFALTLPVTRRRLITGKLAAAAVNALILNGVTWGVTLLGARAYAPDAAFYGFVARVMLALMILQAIFLALGIFLGCTLRSHKRAASLSVSILLGAYFASILAGLSDKVDWLKYLTPFKYFEAASLLHEAHYEPVYLLISAGLVVVLLAVAYTTYQRRDLYI